MKTKIIVWMFVILILSSFTLGSVSWYNTDWDGFWSMDDSDILGNVMIDNAQYISLNNATFGNDFTTGITGIVNEGFSCDGSTNCYMNLTNNPTSVDTTWSASMWFKSDNCDEVYSRKTLLAGYVDSNHFINVWLLDGIVRFDTKSGAGTLDKIETLTNKFCNNGWHFLTVVRNKTGSNGMYIFINGTEQGVFRSNNQQNIVDLTGCVDCWKIGSSLGTINNYNGSLDEVNIWDTDLTTTQINDLFNNNLAGIRADFTTTNLSISLGYPINKTTYYGDYNGLINININDFNGSISCSINDTRWSSFGISNSTYIFKNNTDIRQNNISLNVFCEDDSHNASLNFWFFLENILDIYIYDESTLMLLNETIRLDLISPTFTQNYTFNENLSVYSLNAGLYEISYVADDYSQRQSYINIVTGKKQNITLYLLNSTVGTQIIATLYDEFGVETTNYYIKTYRRIFGDYYLVETSKTNSNGQTDFYGVLDTPMYYFIIEDKDGFIYKQTEETELYAVSAEFNIQITPSTGHIFDKLGNYIFSLTFDNSTNKWTYIFNDVSQTSTVNKLAVYRFSDRKLIAKNQTLTTSGILTIDMKNLYVNGTTYVALATANASPEFGIDSRTFTYNFTPRDMEEMGLFITIIIIVLFGFVGFWNPAVMFIMEALAIILTRIGELHTLEISTTIIITTLLLIIAYLVSDKS